MTRTSLTRLVSGEDEDVGILVLPNLQVFTPHGVLPKKTIRNDFGNDSNPDAESNVLTIRLGRVSDPKAQIKR